MFYVTCAINGWSKVHRALTTHSHAILPYEATRQELHSHTNIRESFRLYLFVPNEALSAQVAHTPVLIGSPRAVSVGPENHFSG